MLISASLLKLAGVFYALAHVATFARVLAHALKRALTLRSFDGSKMYCESGKSQVAKYLNLARNRIL